MTFNAPDSPAEQRARHLAEGIIRGELKQRERIQKQKIIQSRRGAQVTELTPHQVKSFYVLAVETCILHTRAVAERWQETVENLLQAIIARDPAPARDVQLGHGEHNCPLMRAALAER